MRGRRRAGHVLDTAIPAALTGLLAGLVLGVALGTGTGPWRAPAGDGPGPGGAETPSGRTAGPSPGPVARGPSLEPAPSPGAAPSRRFGVVAHLLWGDDAAALRTLDELVAAGLGVVRFDVSWRNMEPQPGDVDGLDRLDRLFGAIAERGMRPVVTVIETPDWANGGRGPWTPPDDPGGYARFLGLLAGRYATVTDVAWEVWNEPNDPRFWQPAPDASAYARLLAAAAHAIRHAAPTATVLGGSILYGDAAFLRAMYDAGARGTFDGLAVHPYAQDRAPADTGDPYHSFAGGLDRLRAVMLERGDAATPMWITEAGWTSADGVDEPTRGRYLAEAVRMVARRTDVAVFAAYVYGPAVEAGFELESAGPGSIAFGAYRAAVSGR